MLIWLAVIAAVIYLDQMSKWLIVTYLPDGGCDLIGGVLRFTYVENTGAAFGMFSQNRWIFLIISSVAILLLLGYMIKWRPKSKLACIALSFIIGGGIGNMIDRVLLGYVVDFIDFCAFPGLWMWVFNIADSFVCVGAGLLIIYLIMSTLDEAKAAKVAKVSSDATANEVNEANEANEATGDIPADKSTGTHNNDENDKPDSNT